MTSKAMSSSLIPKIYKSRKTILDQLSGQGFNIENYDNFSINEIHNLYQKRQMDMLLETSSEEGEVKKVYVKYHITKNLMPTHIYNTVTDLFEMENVLNKETDQIIFIVKSEPNDTLVKTAEQIYINEKVFISILNIDRLQFNILEHSLVPKHIILTPQETEEILEKFNISDAKTQLPTISRFDPVALVIGLRPGQVCEITRPSKTAIKSKFYRICI